MLPHEDQQPASPELPRVELNPATSPLLARNLGRWAQAYFTSPPEKREQAVRKLLCELTGDDPESTPAAPVVEQIHNNLKAQAETVCPQCQHSNQSSSRFCGRCGEELPSDRSGSTGSMDATLAEYASPVSRNYNKNSQPEPGAAKMGETGDRLSVPAIPTDERVAVRLRSTSRNAILAIAIVLASMASWWWIAKRHVPPSNPGLPQKAETLRQREPGTLNPAHRITRPQNVARGPGKTTQLPIAHARSASTEESSDARSAGGVIPPSSRTSLVTDATSDRPSEETGTGPGTHDLFHAKSLLAGENSPRDPAQAARWLWKAVAKGNTSAAILLANLYRSGDGVPKSCDQARLLLEAAARNSNAAGEELRGLETSGCQ